MNSAIHRNFDDAWPADVLRLPARDLREWGPRLRYVARRADVQAFQRAVEDDPARFVLYGSGDFHHLAAVFVGRVASKQPGVRVVCFDNHPDCDIRPPRWACGAWVNRALEQTHVHDVSVWGCGNFELTGVSRLFCNRDAMRTGKLRVFPWRERYSKLHAHETITRDNWRECFETFANELVGAPVYVTVDLDCLRDDCAVTDWESGLFTPDDVAWAITRLCKATRIVGGDVCGARSAPAQYQRWTQRFAARWDHPKLPVIDRAAAQRLNLIAIETIWPTLTSAN
jgi:arginase family enzyme